MSAGLNPVASHHLPIFITPPGETDVLMVVMAVVLVVAVLFIGNLYFRLHSLPEQIAHKGQKLQFQVVAILGLLALFTHQHIFWVAGLLLALVDFPDFSTPVHRMTRAVEKIAGIEHVEPAPVPAHGSRGEPEPVAPAKQSAPPKAEEWQPAAAERKELSHA
jgi:hypothetical protein